MCIILLLAKTLVMAMPVIAALWGMVLVACCYEWRRYMKIVQGAQLAPATGQWLVIERRSGEYVRRVRCQELVIRRYSYWP